MKKIICLLVLSAFIVGCGTYRSLDLNRLTTGMTKADVERVAGLPDRILAVNETKDGYQEVLEYRTSRGEIYALEFWDDYLTGYEYMYEDTQYVPSLYPPAVFPPYGRPLYVYPGGVYHPGYYNRPNYNYNRPGNVNRPNNNNNNSNTGTPPTTVTRPNRNPSSNSSTGNSNNSGTTNSDANRTNRTNRSE